ncbi:metal-dependent transcriptional regulator [Micrococcus endophyticus]|uniref:metal-dependent transcriptional regulator n=1 Tax=Micrococcus endophyticus TaxID=455343 RepID=UPI002002DAD0|nr:metal-dependent transcriptional regulator [Micrococcus endophyticus]MCK6091697.1 metal-dependent transcriptional regulator [Micrococcus endophyticus]
MTDLIDTTEMYLRTILELEEEGIPPLRARIVERLEHSGPTVSQTVGRMERDGLVHVGADRRLQLTVTGRELAVAVLRKHRLAERLLADVIGLEWELVHEEACRWEHVMSDQVERRLLALLENPTETPYGTPIPPRPEQASAEDWSRSMGLGGTRLSEEAATPGRFRVRGLAEGVQTDPELLAQLAAAGVTPGRTVTAQAALDPGYVRVEGEAGDGAPEAGALELAVETAAHVWVERLDA